MQIRRIILLFGLANACLYSALLPLWEGFDEAFHYGYVETLWQTGRLPVLGRTLLPKDVAASFRFAPVSHIVHRWIAETTPFDAWFALPAMERQQRREKLDLLRPESGSSSRPNYEAHHPPLAYAVLAPVDWAMSNVPFTIRVLVLRLVGAVFAVVLLYLGATTLCRTVELPVRYENAALFTIFCSEMLYATVAHVANDWLAVGLSALFIAALASFVKEPNLAHALRTAAWLTLGLLTKAYFLVFLLLALMAGVTLVWLHRTRWKTVLVTGVLAGGLASPWYARNFVLYNNVSGTHEQFNGIGMKQALQAVPDIDWPATTGFLARASLWTGNNSFTSFSRGTLHVVLALLLLGVLGWIFQRKLVQAPEWMLFAAIGLFSLAVAYASCASFANTRGEAAGASPWYTQVLLAPVVALAYLGMSRSKGLGPVLATCSIVVWTWVFTATWIVKLFPMYSGRGTSPMHIRDIWIWYIQQAAADKGQLSLLALAPAPVLYLGLVVCLALSILLSTAIIRNLWSLNTKSFSTE